MSSVNFNIVTDDICKFWDQAGKETVIKLCNERINSGRSFFESIRDSKDIRRILYEVTYQVLLAKLKTDEFLSVIKTLKESKDDICSVLVDVWSMIDIELVALDDKKLKEKFKELIKSFKDVVGTSLLKERLDVETLEQLGLIQSTKLFQQKYIKTKTRLFYKQQKFNLLREEMEGYSKLSVELGDFSPGRVTPNDLLENIKSLIGCFNIDPNRVLDLILESFECHPQSAKQLFVPLLENYLLLCERSTLCHLLGFKFFHYQVSGMVTPDSLYTVAALLVQNNLVNLDDLLPHLVPENEVLSEEWRVYMEGVKTEAKRTSVMVLNPAEKKEEKEVKMDVEKVPNQKFGLCEALIRVGDWNHARQIFSMFEHNHVISHQPIASALCRLVACVIDPVYKKFARPIGSTTSATMDETFHTPPPLAHHFADLPHTAFPMLYHLGPKVSSDPALLVKLTRLGKTFFTEYNSSDEEQKQTMTPIFAGFLGIVSEVILPSLSLLLCNPNASAEVWLMLKLLPYEIRYRLYGEWKNECYEKHPELMLAKAHIIDRTKYIMRRLTKENVKQTGRQMGKLSHSSPTILFDSILSQIQRYDNLILPVVDALKYLTDLTYDCLAFCIIEALANPQKERMKHDDTNISNWLQSLACFCGAIFKKYTIELSGLLQYVANQLKAGKSLDLLIMKEVVQKMSGIEISEEITRDQLEALSGGEMLKAEGGYFGQIRNTKKSSNRLKDALLEQQLALPLCLLMAQQRQGIVFNEAEDIHLKLVGKLTDQCHDTLVQFGNFLSIQLGTDEYLKRFPPIDVLTSHFHTPADVAFFLSRPMYSHQINTRYDEMRRQERSGVKDKDKSEKDHKAQRYIAAADAVIEPVCQLVQTMHSDKVWLDLSPRFYTTFWSLSLYDIEVPNTAYEREIAKLKLSVDAIDKENSHDGRKRREKERCESLIGKLKDEEKKQEEHRSRVRSRLKQERDGWFLARTTKNDTITKFLQLCIFPRSIYSSLDAVYCARFIHILHQLKTLNFSTLLCFDRIFTDISFTVACLTENEASRYGRFLCTMLEVVKRWHSDKATYDKECGNYPGFVTVLRASTTEGGASKANQLDFENFRHVCHKWQYKLTKAIVVCLESKEFSQIRNAVVILTKILPHFPAVTSLAAALEKRIDKIRAEEKEKRPDLFALAMGYSGMLKMKKSSLVPENVFHNKAAPKAAPAPTKPSASGDKSSKDRGKSKEKGAKRKSEDKREKTPKVKDASKNGEKKRSSSKPRPADDAKVTSVNSSKTESDRGRSHDSKSAPTTPTAASANEREHKRRKVDDSPSSTATAVGKEPRDSKKDKQEKRNKSVNRETGGGENGVSGGGGDEKQRGRNRERKRDLAEPELKEPEPVKRHKPENGDRRSKERSASKSRKSDGSGGRGKKDFPDGRDMKKDRASKDRLSSKERR